jgi:solute carrier family 25 (mitochondrial phosphate transporter), member 23/24/25/41
MKILFQIQGPGSPSYTGVWGTLLKMWKEEGWRGFMRGNGTNCIRIVPYSACQFAAYTTYKRVRFSSLLFSEMLIISSS